LSRDIRNVAEFDLSTFCREYLRENETETKNILGRESGAQMLIDEKTEFENLVSQFL